MLSLTESPEAVAVLIDGVALYQDFVVLFQDCTEGGPKLTSKGLPRALRIVIGGKGYRLQGHQETRIAYGA